MAKYEGRFTKYEAKVRITIYEVRSEIAKHEVRFMKYKVKVRFTKYEVKNAPSPRASNFATRTLYQPPVV